MTDSSPVDTAAPAVAEVSDATSESSTENKGVGSMLDAVTAALKEPEAAPASTEQGSEEPGSQPTDTDEVSDEEKKLWSERTQSRFRGLVEAKRAAEAEKTTLSHEIEVLKPKVERIDRLEGFMREHRIEPVHLNNALQITAAINRGDYDKAIPVLENLLNQVRKEAGDVLPEDLKRRVELGYIPEADAKALHKAKLAETRATQRADETARASVEERQRREIDTMANTASQTADAWAKEQATSDPDWNQKRALVMQTMELELRRGGIEKYPKSPQAVRGFLEDIKKQVEAQLKPFRPTPKSMDMPTGGRPSPRAAAKPSSMMDAIQLGLANAG